jgi:hypothetical protein
MATLKEAFLHATAPDADADVDVAYNVADKDRTLVAKVHQNVERNTKIVSGIEQSIRDEALGVEEGGSDANLKKLKAQRVVAREALQQSEDALVAAQERAAASARLLDIARGAGDLKRLKRLVAERRKRAEAFDTAARDFVKTYLALLAAGSKITNQWIGPAPAGAMLFEAEVQEEAGYFLASLCPMDSLSTKSKPIGAVYTSHRNSHSEIPLLQKLAQADEYIIRTATK